MAQWAASMLPLSYNKIRLLAIHCFKIPCFCICPSKCHPLHSAARGTCYLCPPPAVTVVHIVAVMSLRFLISYLDTVLGYHVVLANRTFFFWYYFNYLIILCLVLLLFLLPSVLLRCWLGSRKGIQPVKNSEMQICILILSWCHCHSLSLASVKSRLVLLFWYWLSQVVLDKGLLNGCCCCCYACYWF